MSKIKLFIDWYITRPLILAKNKFRVYSNKIADRILAPALHSNKIAEIESLKRQRDAERDQDFLHWILSNTKKYNTNPKVEAGKLGAEKRWKK